MKRIYLIGILFIFLVGCKGSSDNIDRIMEFRTKILRSDGCSFKAEVTADYSQQLYTFKMQCIADNFGQLSFEILAPESIKGISGTLSAESGRLTFDDHVLLFSMMADGRLSPVSAPWVMLQALRSGYISGCERDDDGFYIHIDDSYDQDPLQLVIHTDIDTKPVSAEIYYRSNRILTVIVEDFFVL